MANEWLAWEWPRAGVGQTTKYHIRRGVVRLPSRLLHCDALVGIHVLGLVHGAIPPLPQQPYQPEALPQPHVGHPLLHCASPHQAAAARWTGPKGKATLCPGQSLSFISRQKKIEPHELKFVPPPLPHPLPSRWASRIVACGRRLRAPPAEHGSVPREEPCRGPARPAAAAQTRPRRRGRSGDGVGEEAAARGSCGGGVARAVSERARRGGGDEICVRGRRAWPLAAAAG